MAGPAGSPGRGGRVRTATVTLQAAAIAAMLGLLGLAAALPAAGQPLPAPAGVAASSDHAAYLQRVQVEMDGWRLKLHGMTDEAKATGQETVTAARSDLRAAWSKTEADARKLQTASTAGWDDAKSSFEQASQDLQHAWDKTLL